MLQVWKSGNSYIFLLLLLSCQLMLDSLQRKDCSTPALPDDLNLAVHFLPLLSPPLYTAWKKKKNLKQVE